ncbi:hypothetical protein BCR42DRAFT_152453 [Absidia repens]|uniref:F-box domain-containing protein n=1 Tax=Absidia repens TaxID=90262 RepID=A0A1X2I1A3_9FUNG|nr:hypothetical protein BCR42DRAFT_152453 [Absidia repens]
MTLAGKISPFGDNNDKRRATEAVIASWPHLKKLHLGHCKFMDDATWIRFVQTHPHLVSVHLSEACLTDASLDAMAGCLRDALSSVVFTNINAISTVGVHRLIQNCKRLVRASFRQCAQILAGDFGKREMDNMRRVHNTNWELDNDEQHLVNTTTVMHLA